jgi:hypothetical protein
MGFLWQRYGFHTALLLGASLSLISGIALIGTGRMYRLKAAE